MEEAAALPYLTIVRYVDSLPQKEKAALLLDSSMTIPSLTTNILLKKRNHIWTDPEEPPTAASLLRVIMPIMDLKVWMGR